MRREQAALHARTHSLCAWRDVPSLPGNLCRILGKIALLVTAHKWNLWGELLKTRISNGERDERQPPGRRMKIGRGVTTEDRLGSTAVPESLQTAVQCGVGLGMSTPRAPRVLHRHRCLMGAGFLLQRAGTFTADFIFH